MLTSKRLMIVAPLAASAFLMVAMVMAQEAPKADEPAAVATSAPATSAPAEVVGDKKLADLWTSMLHFIRVARPELAKSYADAIVKQNPSARDMYLLSVQTSGSLEVLDKASRQAEMKDAVTAIRALIEQGYEGERGDPKQIERAINSLVGGPPLQYENAKKQLQISGEYALPQLVQKIGDPKTPETLKERLILVLPDLGKDGVAGLSVALQSDNAAVQEVVATALGKVGYSSAGPYLKELSQRKGVLDRVKTAADTALVKVAGKEALTKSVAELAYATAQGYYNQEESLRPDARVTMANVWFWQDKLGLVFKPVPREIFDEIYAMRLSKMALSADPKFYPAMSLWLAADFRKESQLTGDIKDPLLGPDTPPAQFFALASPPEILEQVLAIGLKEGNLAIATGATEALVKTSGAKSITESTSGGVSSLVSALTYGDRRVRFLAAVSLAEARPAKRFNGAELVVGVLNEALSQSGKQTALLIAADEQSRNALKSALRDATFDVSDFADAMKALSAVRASGGMDVAVLSGGNPAEVVAAMRKDTTLATLPIVILGDDTNLRNLAKSDGRIVLTAVKAEPAAVVAAVQSAIKLGVGAPLTPDQATSWAFRSADAVRMLTLTGNSTFDVSKTQAALIAALNSAAPKLQIAAAGALAAMKSPDAQQAVAVVAVKAETAPEQKIELLKALTESIRAFGNQMTDAQIKELYAIVVSKEAQNLREAAAQAYGALNLPSERSMALIIDVGE